MFRQQQLLKEPSVPRPRRQHNIGLNVESYLEARL